MKILFAILIFMSFNSFSNSSCPKIHPSSQTPVQFSELICETIINYYPELQNAQIFLKPAKMKWAILQSRFGIKRAFSKNNHYIIEFNAERVYEALHEVSREAFQSILLHELGHTLTYYHNSFLQNLNLIFVITNNRRNQAFEKITDIIAISRSLDRGFEIFNGLIEYRNWHQEHLSSTELKNYLVTYYQEDELINLKSYLSSASSPELKPTIEKLILNLNQIANLPLGFLEKL